MRIFLSHGISTSHERPPDYRDDVHMAEELDRLAGELTKDGHRVFEYRNSHDESKEPHIIRMMVRQIELADALIFVSAREHYDAPGWVIPELFYAAALGKQVLYCSLTGRQVAAFGDRVSPVRFKSLLYDGHHFLSVAETVAKLRSLKEPPETESNEFDLSACVTGWLQNAKIESFLVEFTRMWDKGYRPAGLFMQPVARSSKETVVSGVSSWMDPGKVIMEIVPLDRSAEMKRLAFLNAESGESVETPWPFSNSEWKLVAAGAGPSGEPVVVGRRDCAPFRLSFRQFVPGTSQWEGFEHAAEISVTVSHVNANGWMNGNDLLFLNWTEGRATAASPDEASGLKESFRRFQWRRVQAGSEQGFQFIDLAHTSGIIPTVRRWTLLSRALQVQIESTGGETPAVLACNGLGAWCGLLSRTPAFSSIFSGFVQEHEDDGPPAGRASYERGLLRFINQVWLPPVESDLVEVFISETEDVLELQWRGSHGRHGSLRKRFSCRISRDACRKLIARLFL